MRNILNYCVSDDDIVIDGETFISRYVSKYLVDAIEQWNEKQIALVDKYKSRSFISKIISGKKQEKDYLREKKELEIEYKQLMIPIYNELSIPDDNEKIDCLYYPYEIKKGKEKSLLRFQNLDFMNTEFIVYRKKDNLCLSNCELEISIPISQIRCIEEVKKHIILPPQWNKDESWNSERYKAYKIETRAEGFLIMKYYIIHIGNDYGLIVPDYDIEKLEKFIDKMCMSE